jgi:hypothetical protein
MTTPIFKVHTGVPGPRNQVSESKQRRRSGSDEFFATLPLPDRRGKGNGGAREGAFERVLLTSAISGTNVGFAVRPRQLLSPR